MNFDPSPYNFSFTAASLRPELVNTVVEHYFRSGSWEQTKLAVLATNALQAKSPASSIRMEREIRQRLQTLTSEQLDLLFGATRDVRTQLAWLAAVKHSSFLFDFSAGLMRSKLEVHDTILRASDYERFVQEKAVHHPELTQLTDSSSIKIRRVLLRMLREVQLLGPGTDFGTIERIVLPAAVKQVICREDPIWLAAFLLSDAEIRFGKGRPS